MMLDMDKTTILLPHKLRIAAADQARQMGISLGELIRRRLQEAVEGSADSARKEDSLFAAMDRLGSWSGDSPSDLSVKHDHFLYGEK